MSAKQVELGGTLKPDGTLELDQRPGLPAGRVKVVLQSIGEPEPPKESLLEFMMRTRREAEARGSHFMNDEEVTAWIEELRAEDDRIEEVYRQMEEERRREQHGC